MGSYEEKQQESYRNAHILNEEERRWMKMIGFTPKQPYIKKPEKPIAAPKGLQEQYKRNPRTYIARLKRQMDFIDIRLSGLENAIMELRLKDDLNGTHTKPDKTLWGAHEAYRDKYIALQMEYTYQMNAYGLKIQKGDKYAFTGKP